MNRHDIVPAYLAVEAMRDNGYKNAAYALAELMDNSIQAGATHVELLCSERYRFVNQRTKRALDQIAVLDNGSGMDSSTLRLSLQFGNGTHLTPDRQNGMGRFGMGLPSSSISQCQKVEVWTWQNGISSSIYSYLDIESIKRREMEEIPAPTAKPIPELWLRTGKSFSKSGSLVVWSNIDRCLWKTAKAVMENSSKLIGRLYRKFLDDGTTTIRMASFDRDQLEHIEETFAQPNDPGYLMDKTSCPAPFDKVAMFEPAYNDETDDECHVWKPKITVGNHEHEIRVTFSLAKIEARRHPGGRQPGDTKYGRHAAENVGVSLVRAGRELELDQSWVSKSDPVERWWGVEIDFPPALDLIFGVTNNKQSARNFSELARIDVDQLFQTYGVTSIQALKEHLEEEGDPIAPLVELAQQLKNHLKNLRNQLKIQTKDTRGPRRYSGPPAEEVATAATKVRILEGHQGKSDKDELLPAQERQGLIEESLEKESGLAPPDAKDLAERTIAGGLKYVFTHGDVESPAFFSVRPKGGAVIITLNMNHPAYHDLVEVLESGPTAQDATQLEARLEKAHQGLKLLLMAWARYEDEQPDGRLKSMTQEARVDWGRLARKFLET